MGSPGPTLDRALLYWGDLRGARWACPPPGGERGRRSASPAGRRGREKEGDHLGAPPRGGGREAGAGGSTQPRDRTQLGRAPRQAAPTDNPPIIQNSDFVKKQPIKTIIFLTKSKMNFVLIGGLEPGAAGPQARARPGAPRAHRQGGARRGSAKGPPKAALSLPLPGGAILMFLLGNSSQSIFKGQNCSRGAVSCDFFGLVFHVKQSEIPLTYKKNLCIMGGDESTHRQRLGKEEIPFTG